MTVSDTRSGSSGLEPERAPGIIPRGVPRRAQARGRATRRRLLDAAEELFSQKGYAGTSIGDVALRAATGVGTVYHHFPDKRALLLDLIDAWGDRLEAEEGPDPSLEPFLADDVRAALRRWLTAAYEQLRDKPSLYLVALDMSRREPEVGERYRRIERLAIERLRDLFRDGQARGRLRADLDAHAAAFLVHHAIEGAATQLLVHEVREPEPERVVAGLAEMICRHLLVT